ALRVEHVERVIGDAADQQAEMTLAVAERVEHRLPLADVADGGGEADQGFAVADRLDRDGREEARAVPAQAPAFRLEPSVPPRRLERGRGHSRRAILRREE